MSSSFGRPSLAVSSVFALLTAAAVILLAGYYETPGLLIAQIAFIAAPTFIPLALLRKGGRVMTASWIGVALMMSAGWGYVVYLDTRPYTGGGASFAMLVGWAACCVAGVIAVFMSGLEAWLRRRRRVPHQ